LIPRGGFGLGLEILALTLYNWFFEMVSFEHGEWDIFYDAL